MILKSTPYTAARKVYLKCKSNHTAHLLKSFQWLIAHRMKSKLLCPPETSWLSLFLPSSSLTSSLTQRALFLPPGLFPWGPRCPECSCPRYPHHTALPPAWVPLCLPQTPHPHKELTHLCFSEYPRHNSVVALSTFALKWSSKFLSPSTRQQIPLNAQFWRSAWHRKYFDKSLMGKCGLRLFQNWRNHLYSRSST